MPDFVHSDSEIGIDIALTNPLQFLESSRPPHCLLSKRPLGGNGGALSGEVVRIRTIGIEQHTTREAVDLLNTKQVVHPFVVQRVWQSREFRNLPLNFGESH